MALLKGIGKQLQIGIAKETVRGTAKTSADYWIAMDDWAIEERYQNAVDTQVYGVIEDSVSQSRVKNWSEGEIKFPIAGTSTGVILLSLFGTSVAVLHSGESAVYDHTFTVKQSVQHQSVTFLVHDPIATASGATADYLHANGVIHKLDIEYSLGNFVMGTASVKALAGSSVGVALVPSQSAEPRFVPQNLSFTLGATLGAVVSATPIKVKSAKITIDAGDEDDDVLGQVAPRDFLNKEFSVEGQIEAIWQNESDFKAAALANTPQAMRLKLTNSDVTIGTAANPQLIIDLAKVYFTEFSRPIKIKDVVYQTVNFKAAYSLTDALMARATLVNHIVNY